MPDQYRYRAVLVVPALGVHLQDVTGAVLAKLHFIPQPVETSAFLGDGLTATIAGIERSSLLHCWGWELYSGSGWRGRLSVDALLARIR